MSNNNDGERDDEICDDPGLGAIAKILIVFYIIFKVCSMVLAGYLSWNCGLEDLNPIRVFKTSFSVIFSEFYLLYFFVNSIVLGRNC